MKDYCVLTNKLDFLNQSKVKILPFFKDPLDLEHFPTTWSPQTSIVKLWQLFLVSLSLKTGALLDLLHIWKCCPLKFQRFQQQGHLAGGVTATNPGVVSDVQQPLENVSGWKGFQWTLRNRCPVRVSERNSASIWLKMVMLIALLLLYPLYPLYLSSCCCNIWVTSLMKTHQLIHGWNLPVFQLS